MKLICKHFFAWLILPSFFFSANAQNKSFTDATESNFKSAGQKRVIIPSKFRTVSIDSVNILSFLRSLPSEQNIKDRSFSPVIELPMPYGGTAKFHIWESAAMEPGLAAAFPNIKTFTGQGIDDPTATIKADWTEFGFHAMIISPINGTFLIDPYDQKTVINYISYYKKDHKKKESFQELHLIKSKNLKRLAPPGNTLAAQCTGAELRTYRLAVACTHQYAIAATGNSNPSKSQVLAKIVTTINRVNSVYEKEVAIRLTLIGNETNAIFTSVANDPFTGNDNPTVLIDESQQKIDSAIGSANYDIGQTFSTGTAGYSGLGVVCVNGQKGMSVTGIANPTGDAFDIDYVSHEIGHEFGADHTFNNDAACGQTSVNQNAEPGSGSTIMAYAGVCSDDNLQSNTDPQFHAVSFNAIVDFGLNGSGGSCGVATQTGNIPPVVIAGAGYIIPKSTPFVLSGTATDANDPVNALTYSWEQVDVGGPNGPASNPAGDAPIFRSFPPVANGTRYFPRIQDVISNVPTLGELMPTYSRTLHFRLTVRDNHAAGGGVCFDENAITVNANAGPFVVTYPNTIGISWFVNDFQTITWNPAGTAAAPINCSNVNIQLSTDGGFTFPITLAANTPNDGTQEIQVPNNITGQARIRIIAVGNVFYNMSAKNFTIQAASTASFAFSNPVQVALCTAGSAVTTLKTGSLKSFATAINLTASLNPPGTTVSFEKNPLNPGDSTTVTLNNTGALAAGTYTVRVTGIAGAVTKTRDISFLVSALPVPPSTLSLPSADAIGITITPAFSWSAVAGATSYILEISTSNTFTPLTQTISNITVLPYTLAVPLDENTIYYWRVKSVNACTGAASATMRFKTGLNSCRISLDVPKLISASGTPTITSTLIVPAALGATITDLNVVGLSGTHSYVGDLTFTLTSPSNTSVVLIKQVCGGVADFSLNLDDQATANIPCPPTGGVTAKPLNPLAAFNGQNSTGTWTLTVDDGFDFSGGQLSGWGLSINTNANNCTFTAPPFLYTFTGNGNWNVAANWAGGIIPPATLPANFEIVINHAAGGQCVLNVTQHIATGATLTVVTGKNLVIPGSLTIQ